MKNARLTTAQKNANKKQWYKEQADSLDKNHYGSLNNNNSEISEYERIKINYDLFNNILNLKDFEYICKPFGEGVGELPAEMVNRDIVSGKIKAILGMEMKRSFSWKVIATNPEATTRREQEEFNRVKEFVVSQIMLPIKQQIEIEAQEQLKNQKLNDEQKQKIEQEIAEKTKAMTPESVKKYMMREHQDPSEVLSHQLLEYLTQKCDLKNKFNDAFKNLHLSAKEILYIGIFNGEPEVWNVNPLRFSSETSPDNPFVEDGEWAVCEYRMTPSEVIKYFGEDLEPKEIDSIYENYNTFNENSIQDSLFINDNLTLNRQSTTKVLHCVWKALRKINFLTYIDETGQTQTSVVNELYKLNKDAGDISLESEWIPEVYETWKINSDIYVKMRPVPGQFKDINNLYHCKLPYYGGICDSLNSTPTCLMDRLKIYQYYYNIVMYRLELLLASDKGKKVMLNMNSIPKNADIDMEKWLYFFESTPFMFYDPSEEGTAYNDVNTMAKQIDLSLVSDIGKYIEFAEFLKRQAGISVGITEQVEGQISPNEAVGNTRQSLVQSSHILEPYFELHNQIKKNVLQGLLETAKVAYSQSGNKKLTYILDDMSRQIINLDVGLLDNSTLGVFVSNSSKGEETKEVIRQLAHAALQNQKVELSDMISVLRQESIVETEEILKVAEQKRVEQEQQMQERQQQAVSEEQEKMREFEREKHQMKLEEIKIEQEERRKTEVIKSSLMGASYNPDLDADNDGQNDFIEIAKHGLDAEIKKNKEQLERKKFEHNKIIDKEKLKQNDKKLENDKKKIALNSRKINKN